MEEGRTLTCTHDVRFGGGEWGALRVLEIEI